MSNVRLCVGKSMCVCVYVCIIHIVTSYMLDVRLCVGKGMYVCVCVYIYMYIYCQVICMCV
jgi:hypothetical protein